MRRTLPSTLAALALAALTFVPLTAADARARHQTGQAPYPASHLLSGISWDKSTYCNAGEGGDIWSNTTAPGGVVYTAWGDGAIDCHSKVSYGVAKLTGGPNTNLQVVGCGPVGVNKGKFSSLLAIGSTLYAVVNVQDRPWPHNSIGIWRSTDSGKTWQRSSWNFAGTDLRPNAFANFGAGYAGARDGYVYLTAISSGSSSPKSFYLMRAPKEQLGSKAAYQYFSGSASAPAWSTNRSAAVPVFSDSNGVSGAAIVYDTGLRRYILTVGHGKAGDLGIFEAAEPWGAWSTVDYEGRWLGISSGEYLGVRLPAAWMSGDGKTVWAVFGCYNCGEPFHDHFNLIKGTFRTAGR